LSQQAAVDLLPAAAREGDERSYLAALAVNPRYGRWATQFVALAGMLAEQARPPGWADIPPEFAELEVIGEGPQRQLRRVRLEDITDAVRRRCFWASRARARPPRCTGCCWRPRACG
jgi:hypothetical protein